MKITVYNTKGWAGKTPIATNIILDRGFAIATNEPYHVFSSFIPENKLLSIDLNESFPDITDDIDIVFDLAWSISKNSLSITSALKQSDLVLVPIYNEVKSITAWLHTLSEILNITNNVSVIATKLQRRWKLDLFKNWNESADFKNIKAAVHSKIDKNIPVLPLKFSTVFDTLFEQEQSIKQIMAKSWLAAYQYREVAKQFDKIYSLIDMHHGK